jgi:hypothetical protein
VEHDIAIYDIALQITNYLNKNEVTLVQDLPASLSKEISNRRFGSRKQVTEYTKRRASEEVNLADLNAQAL